MCLTGVLSRGDAVVRSVGNARHGCARLNGDEEGWSSTQRYYLRILQQGTFHYTIRTAVLLHTDATFLCLILYGKKYDISMFYIAVHVDLFLLAMNFFSLYNEK